MRVLMLHLFDLDLTGGSGTHLRAVRRALLDLGYEVDVVSARAADRYGCTTHPLPFGFTPTFGPEVRPGERRLDDLDDAELEDMVTHASASIAERFTHAGPDLLLVNHINLLVMVAQRLSCRWAVPYRVISFGTDTDLLRRAPRYTPVFAEPASEADALFAISGFVASEIRDLLGPLDVVVLGAAADPAVFFPSPDIEVPNGALTYVGRLVTEKGLWVLLDAVERVEGVERLDIIGEGPLRPALEERLARSPLARRVFLVGSVRQEKLRERLVRSTAVVVPSIWQEPLALIIAESLASGVPLIATSVGGIAEMVVDGFNGLVVPPADVGALASAIELVVGDSGLARRLRRNCAEGTRVPTYTEIAQLLVAERAATLS